MTRRAFRLGLLCTLLVGLLLPSLAAAAAQQPWEVADEARRALFEGQLAVDEGDEAGAASDAERARTVLDPLIDAPDGGPVDDALGKAYGAARAGRAERYAAARGEVDAAVFSMAAGRAIRAAARGDADAAKRWLGVRDYRTATRFTRPGADATAAVRRLRTGEIDAKAAELTLTKDLLDGYQSRVRELLADSAASARKDFMTSSAEQAARAQGYFEILAPRYLELRGEQRTTAARERFAALRTAAVARQADAVGPAAKAAEAELDGFTAAPFTEEEQARRGAQLLKFVALVPVEWNSGTKDGRVTVEFELQEARAFLDAAKAAFGDVRQVIDARDPKAVETTQAGIAKLEEIVDTAREGGAVASHERVEQLADQTGAALERAYPEKWLESTDESDFDLIALTLDRMEAAVSAGQFQQAEQARLEAYAFFEFGPELRLNPFDPSLAAEIEGLIWFGARDTPGLAKLISAHAPASQVRAQRVVLDEALGEAQATLGDGASEATIVTNAAVIVFREGLEAVLILAALTASMRGLASKRRRPIFIGAFAGLIASGLTWALASLLLDQLSQYGEKLEAVVGIVAIAVLLLVMNWFFHKVYWTGWIAGFNQKKRELLAEDEQGMRTGFWSAQVFGFGMLGLTSVYREGFETVLFVQSLQLSAGTATVLKGVAIGLLAVGAVAVVTFKLQTKLPYKRMLWVTGILLGAILVILVGQTARTFQGVGWLSIHPVSLDIPYWMGAWLGVFPSWETLGLQLLAAAFVIGSYYAAEWVKIKRPRKRAQAKRAAAAATAGEASPSLSDA